MHAPLICFSFSQFHFQLFRRSRRGLNTATARFYGIRVRISAQSGEEILHPLVRMTAAEISLERDFKHVIPLLVNLHGSQRRIILRSQRIDPFKCRCNVMAVYTEHMLRITAAHQLLLQKETLSPEGEEQLRLLHQKAGYMSELVESLFELTKVSSGVIEAKKEKIDLIRLLEQTTGLFDDQLTNAGLSVRRSYVSDSIPVVTDGARMHQVFANLLGNAIKYALTGTRIYLEVKETECSCLIRMMNTASYEMDFKPDEIMQRFARGDKARSTKGSGLGLAIAQTYTESVGGKFHVAVDGDQFSAIVELPKTERNL